MPSSLAKIGHHNIHRLGAAVVAVAVVAVGCGSSSGPALPAAGELSRAQFVAQISDYFGWFHSSNYNDIWKVPPRTFSDVKATDQYGKQIKCAYEENIIAPDASGKFNPTLAMTRQDGSLWPVTGPVPNSLPNKFNPWVFSYTINVPTGQTSIGLAPIPLSSNVKTITVNGSAILPGTSVPVTVADGTVITIVVTAPDGTTTETYTLIVKYV